MALRAAAEDTEGIRPDRAGSACRRPAQAGRTSAIACRWTGRRRNRSTTIEPAAEAGTVIKRAHPIVQVSIYDAIDCVNQLIGPDGLVVAGADKPA